MGRSRVHWADWDEEQVAGWMKDNGLKKYANVFVENQITGEALPDCLEENTLETLVENPFWRKKIMRAISKLVSNDSTTTATSAVYPHKKAPQPGNPTSKRILPPGKKYDYFGSHKKDHTLHGDSSEQLGMRIKDVLEANKDMVGFFDVDDLKQIDQEHINAAILASCTLLVLLNDESHSSEWCQREWQCARDNSIPIIVIVDTDKWASRPLIKSYIELGFGYLFAAQVISYSSSHRKACYEMIAAAIEEAASQTKVPPLKNATVDAGESNKSAKGPQKSGRWLEDSDRSRATIHESNMDAQAVDEQLRQLIKEKFGDVRSFFVDATKGEGISRKEWKVALQRLGMALSEGARKSSRKRIASDGSKMISLDALSIFVEGSANGGSNLQMATPKDSTLCTIPSDVPNLPTIFHPRDGPLKALIASLMGDSTPIVSLTAPARKNKASQQGIESRVGADMNVTSQGIMNVTSQGMGGCGKTTITVMAVRSTAIRKHFESIAWASVSQKPSILEIQAKLHTQLAMKALSGDAETDADVAFQVLQQFCVGRRFLIVLDDVWESIVEKKLSVLDDSTQSRMLISTRIRGLVAGANEVQVQLLTLQEGVEMLCTMAEIVSQEIPPQLLQIAQLCGRLPLSLSIVGKMIKTWGEGWTDDIPGLLQSDMKGFINQENGDSGLTMQDRVVLSGLNSISGQGSRTNEIHVFFKAMAVFAEDAKIPVPVCFVLWSALFSPEQSQILRVRQALSILIERSLLMAGKLADGVNIHDVVRDWMISCQTQQELMALQRDFVEKAVDATQFAICSKQQGASFSNKYKTHNVECIARMEQIADVKRSSNRNFDVDVYLATHLPHHFSGASVPPTTTAVLGKYLDHSDPLVKRIAAFHVGHRRLHELAVILNDEGIVDEAAVRWYQAAAVAKATAERDSDSTNEYLTYLTTVYRELTKNKSEKHLELLLAVTAELSFGLQNRDGASEQAAKLRDEALSILANSDLNLPSLAPDLLLSLFAACFMKATEKMGFFTAHIRIAKPHQLLECAEDWNQLSLVGSQMAQNRSGAIEFVMQWWSKVPGGIFWGFSSCNYLHLVKGVATPHNYGAWESIMTKDIEELAKTYDFNLHNEASAATFQYTAGDMVALGVATYGVLRLLHLSDTSSSNDALVTATTRAIIEGRYTDFCKTNDWHMSFEVVTNGYLLAEAPLKAAAFLKVLGLNSWSDIPAKLEWYKGKSVIGAFEGTMPDPQLRRVETEEAMAYCQMYVAQPHRFENEMVNWMPTTDWFISQVDERHNFTCNQHCGVTAAAAYERLGRPHDSIALGRAAIASCVKANAGMIPFVAAHLFVGRACTQVAHHEEAITLLEKTRTLAQQCELDMIETHAHRDLEHIVSRSHS